MSLEIYAVSFSLVLARVTAFIGFFPLFGRQQVPAIVKSGLATALTVFWFGAAEQTAATELALQSPLVFLLLVIKEIGIGLILAMLLGFILIPARIAGSYIGQEIGISMEPVTQSGFDQSTIMAAIFEAFAILLFFVLNLHHFLILFLHFSLDIASEKISLLNLPTEGIINLISRLMEHGLSIAAPIAVLSVITLVSLFLLSKAAPSLNLFSIGMPLRIGLGLLAMVLFVPILWRSMERYFVSMLYELEAFFGYFV